MPGRRGRRGPGWGPTPAQGPVLATLHDGERAVIESILGGSQMQARLENMGLRPGKTVTRLSAMPFGGPVMVECGGTRVALGRGIARHVCVRGVSAQTEAGTDRNE
ncbi:MAG: FeoA family protein [Coriobacteriia bacterium]